jgi:hypothetical protein
MQCLDIYVYPLTHGIFNVPINLIKYAKENLAVHLLKNTRIIYVVELNPTYNFKSIYDYKNVYVLI